MGRAVVAGVAVGGLLLGAAYGLLSLKYFSAKINGESMEPYFSSGDFVIFEKEEPRVGSLMVFTMPRAWEELWLGEAGGRFIKRVAALEGATVRWDGESWARDGEVFSSVTSGSCPVAPMEFTLQEGEYFVVGDTEHGATLDSREAFCKGVDFLVRTPEVEAVGRVRKIL